MSLRSQIKPTLSMSQVMQLAVNNAIETSKVMEHAFEFLSVTALEPMALTNVVQHVRNCLSDADEDLVCIVLFVLHS